MKKFIIIFFYGILVYSKTEVDHVEHLLMTLETLKHHQLYAKQSKCRFECKEIAYLGHLIYA